MWKGFEIFGGNLYANKSKIEDSYQGIRDYRLNHTNINTNVYIGDVQITNCKFTNNYRAVSLAYVKGAIFNDNEFSSNTNIKAPFDMAHNGSAPNQLFNGYSGVELYKPSNCEQFNNNKFTDLLFGLYIGNISLTMSDVNNCWFENNRIAGIYTEVDLNINNSTFWFQGHTPTYDMNNIYSNSYFPITQNPATGAYGVYGLISASKSRPSVKNSKFSGGNNFYGTYWASVGMVAENDIDLYGNSFIGIWRGVDWKNAEGNTANIRGNLFMVNFYSIYIENDNAVNSTQKLNLNCNLFSTEASYSFYMTGIYINPNVKLANVGGNGVLPNPQPSGNIWPLEAGTPRGKVPASGDVESSWISPSNWTSIQNDGQYFQYWRYWNEFVGRVYPVAPLIKQTPNPQQKAATLAHPMPLADIICEDIYPITETDTLFPLMRTSSLKIASIENIAQEGVNLYPSPANKQLTIQASELYKNIECLKIYNSLGQQVIEQKNTQDEGIIDVSLWPNGLYKVIIKSQNQSVLILNTSIIVQH